MSLCQSWSKSLFDARGSSSKGWTVLATVISSVLLEYDVSQLFKSLLKVDRHTYWTLFQEFFQSWLIQNYQRCERFVSDNWKFSQFSTLSPRANSLPVYGTLLGQNKSTLGPEKTESHFFEISPLSKLVWIYDKLNTNAKKVPVIGTLRREETLSLSCACLKNYPRIIKKKDRELIKKRRRRSPTLKLSIFPHTPYVTLPPLPHHAPRRGRSVLEREVQNSPYLSPTVIKTLHVTLREVKFTKGCANSPSNIPLPLPLHTHTHTRARAHAPNPWYTLECKSSFS